MQAESMKETKVTYTLEMEVKFYIVENVPARVCEETGEQFFAPETVEQFFAPETVEQLQQTIWQHETPTKMIETPVYEFAL